MSSSSKFVIADGSPVYMSEAIRLFEVGSSAPAEVITSGRLYTMKAEVKNDLGTLRSGRVHMYIHDAALGFNWETIKNSAWQDVKDFVLGANATSWVESNSVWLATYSASSHPCALALAVLDDDDFNASTAGNLDVVGDGALAQRNLSVVKSNFRGLFSLPFNIIHAGRVGVGPAEYEIRLRVVTGERLGAVLRAAAGGGALAALRPSQVGALRNLSLVQRSGRRATALPSARELAARTPVLNVTLPPRQASGATLVGSLEGRFAVVEVEQIHAGVVVGGLVALVVNGRLFG